MTHVARAILGRRAALFLLLASGCTPELTRTEGDLRVIATGLPVATVTLDLRLTRGGETRQLTFPASGDRAEVGVQGLAAGPLTVRAECLGESATLLANRSAEVEIPAGQELELRLDFGANPDAGAPDAEGADAADPGVRSGRIVHTLRLREDDVSAGQLRGEQEGSGAGFQAFWSQAETTLGAVPTQLGAAEADLRLLSSSGLSHLGELYSEVELLVRGLDTQTEISLGQTAVSGTPTSLPLVPSGASLMPLVGELGASRFRLILRGTTPQNGQTDFEAFVELGVIFRASL